MSIKAKKIKRIYHRYEKWEDYPSGFYDSCTGKNKIEKEKMVVEMFNSEELTLKFMNKVIETWVNSCEHNLTNESLNKIAYIGQGACCLFAGIPSTVTMGMWSKLTKETQNRANNNAETVLNKWLKKDKNIQLEIFNYA